MTGDMNKDRRIFLLYGWGRFLAQQQSLLSALNDIKQARPDSNWAILVAHDNWACQYQRLYFRLQRAKYAVNGYGLRGKASYGADGWKVATTEEIRLENARGIDRYRKRAHDAKKAVEDGRDPRDVARDYNDAARHVDPETGW